MLPALSKSKFVGDTASCFQHFVQKHAHRPEAIELMADFCGVLLPTVHKWIEGKHPAGGAGGLTRVRLRCFLTLAGYEVTELQKLPGEVKRLAMLLALRVIDTELAIERLGYKSPNNLWRITVGGEGFLPETREGMVRLTRVYQSQLERRTAIWEEKIAEASGVQVKTPEPTPPRSDNLLPTLATAFGRTVATATSLGMALVEAGGAQAAREATRGGQDLAELIGVLQQLAAQPE